MADTERSMTSPLAEIARATYHDDMPEGVQDRILALCREAVQIDKRERARQRGAVGILETAVAELDGWRDKGSDVMRDENVDDFIAAAKTFLASHGGR